MFSGLAAAIEGVEIPVDSVAISEVLALGDRLDAKVSEALGRFDEAELWDMEGATSMTAWLRDRGLARGDAARRSLSARRLRRLPVTARAWRDGILSRGQVDAILGALSDKHVDRFAEHEAHLVPTLASLSSTDCTTAMTEWRARADADNDDDEPEPREPQRRLHLSRTFANRWGIDGDLDNEGGEILDAGLRLAQRLAGRTASDSSRTPAERRADAMVDILRFFLDHQHPATGGRHRPHVNLVIDIDDLANGFGGRFVNGGPADATTVSRTLCDCALHRVFTSGRSAILDYGTTTRTIPAPLWNALVIRDEHCRFPGCDRTSVWCEGHHVIWVEHHGPTRLDNLALMCVRHHHKLHGPGWHAKLLPDGTLDITDPQGQVRTSHPPRAGPRLW